MEAFPSADEIALILSNYWKTTPSEKRAELPAVNIIEEMIRLVEPAFKTDPNDASLLNEFIEKQGDRSKIDEFSGRLKMLMWRDSNLAKNLEVLVDKYRSEAGQTNAYNINIEWGDSVVSGSTAQVKQDRKVDIDTIDLSKFIEP